jgi:hypothetical protein
MDFYFDIGMAIILRIIRDRRNAQKYFAALAKLYVELSNLISLDPAFARAVKLKQEGD